MLNNTTSLFSDNISNPSTLGDSETAGNDGLLVAIHVIIIVLSPVTVVGNALVLTTIWKKSFQRTPFHISLSALAFCDLCTGVTSALTSIPYLHDITLGPISYIGILCTTYLVGVSLLVITLMSVERWLHMSRRTLVTSRRVCLIAAILSIEPIPMVAFKALDLFAKGSVGLKVNAFMAAHMLSCYLVTSVAYFKVFRIIRQHQQQVHGSQSCQNFGQSAINLAKYKKSVVSILYILALFSVCFLPTIISLLFFVHFGENTGTWKPYHASLVFLFLSSCLNPGLYIWRMKDVRDGVKTLFCING